jgi:ankyrin repeat protein
LERCLELTDLQDALKNLPVGLVETYSRILMRVDAKSREKATTILQLLVWTEEEFELDVIVDALAIRKNKHGLHYEPRSNMPIPEEIVKLLPGLIILDTSKSGRYDKTTVVRLAHYSVKEYLTSDYVFETFKASLEEYNAHISIVDMCMLHFHTFQGFGVGSWARFTSYARDHWPTHARIAQADDSALERIVRLLMSGQEPGNPFYNCVLLCETDLPDSENWDPQTCIVTPLWYASNLGLDRVVSRLFESGTQTIDIACGESATTALEIATQNCHEETVRLLLAYGATPLMTSIPYPTESTKALRILKLLLEHGAKPTFRSLCDAVTCGSTQVIHFLLDNGAPMTPEDPNEHPLLLLAADDRSSRSRYIFRLLLCYGAGITACDQRYATVLWSKIDEGGDAGLIQFLLHCGADPNTPDIKGRSPLMMAVHRGNREVVALLLKRGADALVRNNRGSSAFDVLLQKSGWCEWCEWYACKWYELTRTEKDESNIHSLLLTHMWKQRRSAQAAAKRRRQSQRKALVHRNKIQKREHYGLTFHQITWGSGSWED